MKYDHIHDALIDLTGINFTDEEIQNIIDDHNAYLGPNSYDLTSFINDLCIISIGLILPRFGDTEEYKFEFYENAYKLNFYLEKYRNRQ